MKKIQADLTEMKDFVASLYSDGKTPSERFGMTWKQLSQLEKKNPAIVTKKNCDERCLAM